MIKGLKRSMPCEDVLSLTPPPQEKTLLEANKFSDDSVRSLLSTGKRRRIAKNDRKTRPQPLSKLPSHLNTTTMPTFSTNL
jgi:hypothetical protein